jgi:hypothetical protein
MIVSVTLDLSDESLAACHSRVILTQSCRENSQYFDD